jgi:hypothetical protein
MQHCGETIKIAQSRWMDASVQLSMLLTTPEQLKEFWGNFVFRRFTKSCWCIPIFVKIKRQ